MHRRVALGLRMLLPRWIPLNAAGLQLRERANQLREVVVSTDVPSVAAGEKLLPWAVLFDEASVVRTFAEVAERSGDAPAWYRSAEPFSARAPRVVHRASSRPSCRSPSASAAGCCSGMRTPGSACR